MRKPSWMLLLLLSAPAAAQQPIIVGPTSPDYIARAGDVLQIIVWGQEEYSGLFKVGDAGTIQYPGIGQIEVAGQTMGTITADVRERLGQFFNAPFVTVSLQFSIDVLGEVRGAGLYPVDPTLTVLDIVAMAGGPTENGNINKIRLLRGGQSMDLRFESDEVGALTLQAVGLRSGDQVYVTRRGFTRQDVHTLLALIQIALTTVLLVHTL
jgi:polysaccharide export outer membrane protein